LPPKRPAWQTGGYGKKSERKLPFSLGGFFDGFSGEPGGISLIPLLHKDLRKSNYPADGFKPPMNHADTMGETAHH
jgi:hypothetical protein